MRPLAVVMLLAAACAPAREVKSEKPIAGRPMFLVVGMSPDDVVGRDARLLDDGGFRVPATVRPGMATEVPGLRLLARTRPAEPNRPACRAAREVVELAASPREDESELRIVCFTEREKPGSGGGCDVEVTAGCPNGGDRMVGLLAADAADL